MLSRKETDKKPTNDETRNSIVKKSVNSIGLACD